jgi:hypothetical protein
LITENYTKDIFVNEHDLAAAAIALGAADTGLLSSQEAALVDNAKKSTISKYHIARLQELIRSGHDPLGEAFCLLRSSENRREKGATYTPDSIIKNMMDWAKESCRPDRIVDPGTGSGRFLMKAGELFPESSLIGIDIDPLAALMAKANLAVKGFSNRCRIILGDYRDFHERIDGRTLFVGNPPYVRHHRIDTRWKDWLSKEAGKLGFSASKLAGLHVHFFLATICHAQPGDFGAFITASEWLDVNYGSLVRSLFLNHLGGQGITVIDPAAQPFPDAATTAAIATFEIGAKPDSISFHRIGNLKNFGDLNKGRKIHRERLEMESRWSHLLNATEKPPDGFVELGELCRVHRGQVTGANDVWIAGEHSSDLPESVLYRTVTRAREVLDADGVLKDSNRLRFVIDIPVDLDVLQTADRRMIDRFLKIARTMGANKGYVASHRKAWWAVGLRAAAPIISTYMARRAPAFALNKADARHINIAHGLYPRDSMSRLAKETLVKYLQSNVSQHSGRTYAGGLTKFEPREMERLIVPGPAMLSAGVF